MGRHKLWRKIAKRERRRRIRRKKAKENDCLPSPSSAEYMEWLSEQELIEKIELELVEIKNKNENEKWIKAETIAIKKYKKIEEEKEKQRQQQLENELKLQQEWELEKQRKLQEAERLKEIEQQNKIKQEKFMTSLEKFLVGDSSEPPQELLIYHETRPNTETCPFFNKTACCRFGDDCSRNHQYPGISKILLAKNFYVHFGLENSNFNEYDTDVMLEYEDSDTLRHYKDFFYDVLPEFQKHGQVVEFKETIKGKHLTAIPAPLYRIGIEYWSTIYVVNTKDISRFVCNNFEKHLRGNTYIEYADLRSAVQAYRTLHSRWYGGRLLSLQFCQIASWKTAICGLQSRKRCPKGRACNFLHVFVNPEKLIKNDSCEKSERRRRASPRYWRWSESPERETIKKNRSKSRERREKYSEDRRRHRPPSNKARFDGR